MRLKLIAMWTAGLAFWGFGSWAVAFWLFYKGGSIYEPLRWYALVEFSVAILITLFSLVVFVLLVKNLRYETGGKGNGGEE